MSNEFECKCGCKEDFFTPETKEMVNNFLKRINDKAPKDSKFFITSASRCKKHNKDVGGATLSSHLTGYAIDISCNNSRERHVILKELMQQDKIKRIGIGKNYIHCDFHPVKASNVVWID